MADVCICDLPTATELEKPPEKEDVLLVYDTSTRIVKRCTVEVLLRSISVSALLEHIHQRVKERKKR